MHRLYTRATVCGKFTLTGDDINTQNMRPLIIVSLDTIISNTIHYWKISLYRLSNRLSISIRVCNRLCPVLYYRSEQGFRYCASTDNAHMWEPIGWLIEVKIETNYYYNYC